jgi:hypothetical protein
VASAKLEQPTIPDGCPPVKPHFLLLTGALIKRANLLRLPK